MDYKDYYAVLGVDRSADAAAVNAHTAGSRASTTRWKRHSAAARSPSCCRRRRMTMTRMQDTTDATLLAELSLLELSHCCSSSADWVIELVEEGVIEPVGAASVAAPPEAWRFDEAAVARAAAARRLVRDLSINVAGVALALDLLDEIRALRRRLRLGEAASAFIE
jgi:chaperone modulatory protein CbpM